MNPPIRLLLPALVLSVTTGALTAHAAEPIEPRDEWFRDLDIEPVVGESELILVARVEEVREIPLPVGGKGEQALFQVRFTPARVLKGEFARDELTLTSYELGAFQSQAEIARLEAGSLRLLFLGRSPSGYRNLHLVPAVDRSLPPLDGENDPLTASVKTLLDVRATPDRMRRVSLLTAALMRVEGVAAVPLLKALPRRAVLAAQMKPTLPAITRHLGHASPAVRIAAAEALRAVLAADYLEQRELRREAARALASALGEPRPNISARIALIGAASELGTSADDAIPPLTETAPLAVQQAQVTAFGRLGKEFEGLDSLLTDLPLDHPNAGSAEIALARIEPESAASQIPGRAISKLAAGLSIEDELHAVTPLPAGLAVGTLSQLAALSLSTPERQAFAESALDLAARWPADRALGALGALVTPLSKMLDPAEGQTRATAIAALVRIDTDEAARAVAPRLREETDLSQKLRMAEFLGRHGLRDGYPYAIEHMSEPHLLERAVAALAAIDDPRAIEASRRILETSNDVTWNAAAIRVLGAMGERSMAPRFLEIVADWKNPLAPSAVIALGDLGDRKALPAILAGLSSRNDAIVVAATTAAGRLLERTGDEAKELRDALAALVADSSATEPLRAAALESLLKIEDKRLDAALASAAKDGHLEQSRLMRRIETLLRERTVRVVT